MSGPGISSCPQPNISPYRKVEQAAAFRKVTHIPSAEAVDDAVPLVLKILFASTALHFSVCLLVRFEWHSSICSGCCL